MPLARSTLAIAIAAVFLAGHATKAAEPAADAAGASDAALVRRGAYVAILGDCAACHTASDGALMAGGRELATRFGKVYSTNITPDGNTGIGRYSFEQFDRAMRKGVDSRGQNLYPAMPYPSYAKIDDADMRALYAYLQRGVAPVARVDKAPQMRWPFSMRLGLSLWNFAFLDGTPFKPDPNRDAVWNRGAYLVQGLGHCGSCHTPRGIGFQERAMTDAGSGGEYYLAGETVEGWRALSLRNLWTVEDIARLLKTGQNRFATVSGRMVEVIHHSSQHFTDQDLTAIATYLKSLPPGPDDLAMPALPAAASNSPASDLFSSRGGLGYVQFCADCHRPDGAGVMGIFPPLRANPAVAGSDPSTLIHIVLTGSRTAGTSTHPRVYTMPAFSQLSDQELAEILSFLRADWGNDPTPILTSDVRKLRAALGNAAAAAAEFGTPRLADMLSNRNARQLVRGMLLQLKTRALLPQNVGDDLNCTSCHLNAGTVADSSPFVGVSAFFPSYAARSGTVISLEERINDCLRRSMNGTALPADSADMKAMVAYFDWMKEEARPDDKVAGRGVGKVDMALKPNVAHGGEVYAAQCAVCHGQNGEGLQDDDGRLVFPPLWGDRSFNVGADMARTSIAAGFVSRNMPVGFHEKFPLGQGGLSDQDAIDVAEYFTHKPRPDFPDKVKDWPKDPKPTDARQ